MKLSILKKFTESEKMLNEIQDKHQFFSNTRKFPLPNKMEINFNIDEINTYWVQKDNMGTKKQKKQSTETETQENIDYIDANISSDNIYRYMGKMMKDMKSEYSPEFIVGSLQYLFTKIPYGKINFVIGPKVSEIMNGKSDVENAMSEEEQIDYIKYLTYQYFPERIDDLNIILIQNQHKELFLAMGLKEEDKQSKNHEEGEIDQESKNPLEVLDTDNLPKLESKNFSSLQIAQHLYFACKNNPKFDQVIKSITPPNIKEKKESSYYYGLIEIAFRLTDYLNGIAIQGGKYGQGRYDQFIKTIVMGNHTNYGRDQLDELVSFCQNILKDKDQKFATIHLKTDEYNKYINEQQIIERNKKESILKKNNLYNKIALTSLSLLLLFGGGYRSHNEIKKNQQQKIENKINLENQKKLADKSLGYTYTHPGTFDENTDKIHVLNTGASNVYNTLIERYIEDFDDSKKEELISIIKDELIRSNQINYVNNIEYMRDHTNSFIKIYLLPNHTNQLIRLGFTPIPYEQLKEEAGSMYNLLNSDEDIFYSKSYRNNLPPKFKLRKNLNGKYEDRDFHDLGEYTNSGWGTYKIAFINKSSTYGGSQHLSDMKELQQKQDGEYIPGNIYFLASKDGEIYTKELGIEVINSRLSEGYPLLDDIINFVGQDNIDKNKISAEFIKWLSKGTHNDINLSKQEKIDDFLEFYSKQ